MADRDTEAPTDTPQHIICTKTRDIWDKLQMGMEVLGLVALVAYTIYTAGIFHSNKKAALAAEKAATVAEQTLIASNRPWLDIDGSIASPLTFDDAGAHITLLIEIENVGHSPAVRVSTTQEFIQIIAGDPNPWQELKKSCQQAAGTSAVPENRGVTQTIFPGKPDREAWTLTISSTELAREVAPGERMPYVYPTVVACAAYRADFSEVEHWTGYVWNVNRKNGLIDRKKANIPANELVIAKYPFIGPYTQ